MILFLGVLLEPLIVVVYFNKGICDSLIGTEILSVIFLAARDSYIYDILCYQKKVLEVYVLDLHFLGTVLNKLIEVNVDLFRIIYVITWV